MVRYLNDLALTFNTSTPQTLGACSLLEYKEVRHVTNSTGTTLLICYDNLQLVHVIRQAYDVPKASGGVDDNGIGQGSVWKPKAATR